MKKILTKKGKKPRSNSKVSHSKKLIILEKKKRFEEIKSKEQPKNDSDEEDDFGDIEFSEGFRLNPSSRRNLENIPMGSSLEGGLAFAPRIKNNKDKEGKNYSETKYETNYTGNKYGEKTPNDYADKELPSDSSEHPPNQ